MNILWIPNFLPFPANNGGKVVISNRMRQVGKCNRIFLLVEDDQTIDESTQKEIDAICEQAIIVPKKKRTKLYHVAHLLLDAVNVGRYKNSDTSDMILSCLEKYDIDIINLDLPMLFVNLLPIKNRLGKAVVVINQHNLEYKNVRSKVKVKGLNPLIKLYAALESHQLFKWEKRIYREDCIKGFTFVSDADVREFQNTFNCTNKMLLLSPIGTNILECRDGDSNLLDGTKKNIVFPAAFDYGPNVFGAQWFVKEVFPKIKGKVHDAELYLVGKSPKEEVKKLAAHDIKVTGTVPDMLPYMKEADLFIVPIFFGGGVKTKLIEMGCWKKPIVTTEEGRVGTIYTDDDVCIANSPADFALGCINALQHPETYAPRCEGMYKKTVDNYLWDNIGEKYINFLNEIILQNEEK